MDPQRQRIQEDLRGLVAGDVRCDDVFLQLFASDASLYELKPLAVVRPRNTADVSAVVKYAAQQRIAIHARGTGTGLAGESLGTGIVVDFSRYMRRIIRTESETVRVQPGVVLALLNQHLRAFERIFGPDPANSNVTTMGSVIAVDASGSYWPKYGSARQHVVSLQVALADGTVMELGREELIDHAAPASAPAADQSGNGASVATAEPLSPVELRRQELVQKVSELLQRNSPSIAARQSKSLVNRCGYQLTDVLSPTHLHLARLLCGSEGTLALVTEATLATQPLPTARGAAMLFFDRLENAALAVQEILPFEPSACDLLDRRHLSLARETSPEYEVLIPAAAEALLLVEYSGDDAALVRQRLTATVDRVRRKTQLAFDARQAFDYAEVDLYWQLARRVVPTLHRLKGSVRPVPIVEDVAVPPAQLPEFLVRLQNTLKRQQVTASLYGHVGHGQLHLRPFIDLASPEDVQKMETLAAELYAEVLAVGGTISGEHGDGYSRTPFVRQQYGALYDVFRELKAAFDPLGILNPGKIVTDEPVSITRNLRPVGNLAGGNGAMAATAATAAKPEKAGLSAEGTAAPAPSKAPADSPATPRLVELHLNWNRQQLLDEAQRCNGCGACRSQLPDVRMCPIFRVLPAEEASPRAKANLLRAIFDGRLDADTDHSEEYKAVADLCVNCHQCRLECPAGIDIPKLMIEAKAMYIDANGLRPGEWLLARFDKLSKWGSKFSLLANWAISNRPARWVMEKTLGIAQGRKLPQFARRSFARRAARRRLTRPTRRTGRKVLYFVDTYANYHDPQLADALVAVMEHNGVAVYVHPDQKPSGMGLITMGSLGPARRLAMHNLHLLAEAVRQGYHIVASEPSTALCLTHEYLNLIDDGDARAVAANSSDACAYLWALHQQGLLQLDLKPLNTVVGYHQPCHIRALGVGSPSENLLKLIPGLSVQCIDRGCSGMAGLWGLKRENYRTSLRAGWGLISRLRDPGLQIGATECSCCKIQMEQGTPKPTIHPLKLLALSYGLMPEISQLLTKRAEELVVT
ncbi:MAG TPA: anaerobic glycerol-3-phosphate dehydrogenase subunit C [Pirellulales bacterium]|jgi:FAD/FMN-containing dehydrogenase/Fe-S oxidoreductase|nr:anaerobic glycerol-3-phosphate dehydrogenase subunit C [Pirellulales bacterium]